MTYSVSSGPAEDHPQAMLGLLATAATLAAHAAAPVPAWRPDVDAAERFARTRRGTVTFAVRTECGAWGRRQDRAVPSASVLKAMLLVAELQRADLRDRPLTAGQRSLLSPMIRRSDNAARRACSASSAARACNATPGAGACAPSTCAARGG
jgi:hypothetical protein